LSLFGLARALSLWHRSTVQKNQRRRDQPPPQDPEALPGVEPHSPTRSKAYLTKQWLDDVAAGTEKSIRDTPAWKDAVHRLGLKEVRRRLRLGCLTSQYPDANPLN